VKSGTGAARLKSVITQLTMTLKLNVVYTTVDEYSRELTVSVNVCVPMSVGS